MKRRNWLAILIVLILVAGVACTAHAEDLLPADIRDTINELTVIKTAYWDNPGSTWLILARTPYGENMLLCFVRDNNSWVRSFYTVAAIPQGENIVEEFHITDRVQDYVYNHTWPGPILMIMTKDGNYTSYQRSDSGEWNLFKVFWFEEQTHLDYSDDSIAFRSPISQDHNQYVTVQGSFERDLRKVDINTIPKSPQQAQEMLNETESQPGNK